jgi:enoyl-CoA hydratase
MKLYLASVNSSKGVTDMVREVLRQEEPYPGVILLTLALPELRNAMTAELTSSWLEIMTDLKQDPEVRAVVVTGDGGAFCSGGDLSWLDHGDSGEMTPDRLRDRMLPFYDAWLMPRELPVPVIAAINGPAVGAGLALALSCDLRYAGAAARFSAPFLRIGTHGGMAATWLLSHTIGMPRAREMIFTCREVRPEEALEWGLVTGVFDDVVAASVEVAEQIAQAAPIAARYSKAGFNQISLGFETALQWDALTQPVTMATQDFQEGIRAARERRTPRFRGR